VCKFVYVFVCRHLYLRVCACARVYLCMYVCMYVCMSVARRETISVAALACIAPIPAHAGHHHRDFHEWLFAGQSGWPTHPGVTSLSLGFIFTVGVI